MKQGVLLHVRFAGGRGGPCASTHPELEGVRSAPLRRSLGVLRGGSVLIDARRGGGKKTGSSENISQITEKVQKANGRREETSGAKEPTTKNQPERRRREKWDRMPLAQLADPWQKMPMGGTSGEVRRSSEHSGLSEFVGAFRQTRTHTTKSPFHLR